jgi:hypothetical protein
VRAPYAILSPNSSLGACGDKTSPPRERIALADLTASVVPRMCFAGSATTTMSLQDLAVNQKVDAHGTNYRFSFSGREKAFSYAV